MSDQCQSCGSEQGDSANQDSLWSLMIRMASMALRRRHIIGWGTLSIALVAVAYALWAPPVWTATVKFLPTPGAAPIDQISAMPGFKMAGGSDQAQAALMTPEYYFAQLQSPGFLRPLLTSPVSPGESATLLDLLTEGSSVESTQSERLESCIEALQASLAVTAVKSSTNANAPRVMALSVSARDAEVAATLANRMLDAIVEQIEGNRNSMMKGNLAFIAAQFKEAELSLEAATDNYTKFSMHNRRIETPDIKADDERLARKARVQEEIYLKLSHQKQMAQLEEQLRVPPIQVIQAAEAPKRRASPNRTSIVVSVTMLGFIACCFIGFVVDRWESLRAAAPSELEELDRAVGEVRNELAAVLPFPRRSEGIGSNGSGQPDQARQG